MIARIADDAWDRHVLATERSQARMTAILCAILVPVWILVDLALEPLSASEFLAYRAVAIAVSLAGLAALRRAERVGAVRAIGAAVLGTTGAAIALMLPGVREHRAVYVLGFSLVFWGSSALLTWPVRWVAGTFAFSLAVWLTAELANGTWPSVDVLGAGFYLASAAIIGASSTHLRRELERRAFVSTHRLAQRNRDLAGALSELKETQSRLVAAEKLSAVGRLLAGLSHEINNPINVVHNNIAPLREYAGAALEIVEAARRGAKREEIERLCREREIDHVREDLPEALDAIAAATERLRTVHADFRGFVRGDAPAKVEGDVNEGLRATAGLLRRGLPRGVRFETDLGTLPQVPFRPGPLNQVFFNLIQNAIDAVGEEGSIVVRTRATEGHVRIEVEDTGPGVPAEARDRLFEPFFTTKPIGRGTGLGLAISYRIVQDHGGTLQLDPTWTKGARFVVLLPIRPNDAAPPPGAGEALRRSMFARDAAEEGPGCPTTRKPRCPDASTRC